MMEFHVLEFDIDKVKSNILNIKQKEFIKCILFFIITIIISYLILKDGIIPLYLLFTVSLISYPLCKLFYINYVKYKNLDMELSLLKTNDVINLEFIDESVYIKVTDSDLMKSLILRRDFLKLDKVAQENFVDINNNLILIKSR